MGAARLRSDPEKAVDRVSRVVEAAGVKDEDAASYPAGLVEAGPELDNDPDVPQAVVRAGQRELFLNRGPGLAAGPALPLAGHLGEEGRQSRSVRSGRGQIDGVDCGACFHAVLNKGGEEAFDRSCGVTQGAVRQFKPRLPVAGCES
jgi:hypothetical protein